MPTLDDTRFHINFSSQSEQPIEGYEDNTSGIIPASVLGNIVLLTNEIMQTTWDYAWWHTEDERFEELRRLDATGIIDRQNVELVVVSFEKGSLDVIFDWSTLVYGTAAIIQSLPPNITANALWDLTKYSFRSIWQLIREREDDYDLEPDPIASEILPQAIDLAREAYKHLPNGVTIKTKFEYVGPEDSFYFEVDQRAQDRLLEANRIEIELATRLTGSIVGIDYYENTIGIRFEQFPEKTMWCDIAGFNLSELRRFLPRDMTVPPQKIGFDVELGWRRGSNKIFPPDSVRILQIVPKAEVRNLSYADQVGLSQAAIHSMKPGAYNLNRVEQNFLKWLFWADENWTDPNFSGIVGYLSRRSNILEKRLERAEVESLVRSFVQQGILLRTQSSKRRSPSHQALRLNMRHPAVVRFNRY